MTADNAPAATKVGTVRALAILVAVLLCALLTVAGLLAVNWRRAHDLERDRWSICMNSYNILTQLNGRGVHQEYDLVETVTNLGVTQMCTGEVNPSTWECWMKSPDRDRCFQEFVAMWHHMFESHVSEWGEP